MARCVMAGVALVAAAVAALFVRPALGQDVKYEKYTLDNGMTVILHEDHTLPVATVNTWYRVGGKDEPVGRSGFAHLFEHLMFMGTQRVPNGQFDALMEAGGGANNASTAQDRTNYFSAGPASLLPTLLWLDADRLEDLGAAMNQEKLDRQRDVVRNELRQNVENTPYGRAEVAITQTMYPEGHPYHGAVIGSHEDLDKATVFNVKDFFANYYVPSNASLVVAGDFKPAEIKPLIQQLFGTLPRGGEAAHQTAPQPVLGHVIRQTMLDKVQIAKVSFVYHSPANFAPGSAEVDLAGAILSEGKSSRLYKRLVYDDKLAVSVSAGVQEPGKLGSLFQIDVMAQPGVSLDQIEKEVDEEVGRFIKDGPTERELEEHKAPIELGTLARLQSVAAVADKLNEYEFYFGEPNSFKRDLDRYRAATVGSVKDWASRVLTPGARLIMRVLPEAPEHGQSARDQRPQDFAPKDFAPPPPETFALKNGLKVMFWRRDELPLVSVHLLVQPAGGGALTDPSRAGLAPLGTAMMEEGAGELDALQFGEALQLLGAQFSTGADHETATASLTVLKRNFDKAAALMADAVRRPRMEQKDWERVKRLHLEGLKEEEDEPATVASHAASRAFFGEKSPYAWPVNGTAESVEPLKLEDVQNLQRALFRPDTATLLVAGALGRDEAQKALEKAFGDWKAEGSGAQASIIPATGAKASLQVFIVDRPSAVQTVIRFIGPGVKEADAHRVPYRLLNTILGGSFTSRLNQNLREQHGYTYGASSRFVMEPSIGYFTAGSSVRADVTGASLKEFLSELRKMHGGDITEKEAGKAAQTLRTGVIQSFEGLNGLLSAAADLKAAGLPVETVGQDLAAMKTAKAAGLNAAAAQAVDVDRGVLVLVGDKKLVLEQIKDLGLPEPVELDVDGASVRTAGDQGGGH
jgi:zinc protease